MNIIIPMSGIGKRFLEAGYTDPKPLIPVEGKPIIQHVVERFDTENDTFIFVCNEPHLRDTPMRSVLERIVKNKTIVAVPQEKYGPVWATLQASHLIQDDEAYVVNYCDFSWRWDYNDFKKMMLDTRCDGSVISYKGFHPHLLGPNTYASMRATPDHRMIEIREKYSFTPNKMDCYQSSGTYYFSKGSYIKKYFRQLMNKKIDLNGEYYVSLVYNELKTDGLDIFIYEIPYFLQWGTPADLKEYLYWSNYFLHQR